MKNILIIIDMQNDFCHPQGSLVVPDALRIIPEIKEWLRVNKVDKIIASQDYHPQKHVSFASNYKGKKVFDSIDLGYTQQVLWPDHCVQGTWGSSFIDELKNIPIDVIVQKGQNISVDSYSAFFENDGKSPTELVNLLKPIKDYKLFICGVARNFCVEYTYQDALKLGYDVQIIEKATRGVLA